jgi:hypothetical protein
MEYKSRGRSERAKLNEGENPAWKLAYALLANGGFWFLHREDRQILLQNIAIGHHLNQQIS